MRLAQEGLQPLLCAGSSVLLPQLLVLAVAEFSSALAAEQRQPLVGTSMPFVASPGFQDELILN